jgi:hypothetical protein
VETKGRRPSASLLKLVVETICRACFMIHARFDTYTGDGMEELWPVGTHRLLWAMSGTEKVEDLLGDRVDDFSIFGDFAVCPLTIDVSGAMRHVCIKEAGI